MSRCHRFPFKCFGRHQSSEHFLRGLNVSKERQHLGAGGCKGLNKPGKEKKRSLVYEYCIQQSYCKRIQVCAFTAIIESM